LDPLGGIVHFDGWSGLDIRLRHAARSPVDYADRLSGPQPVARIRNDEAVCIHCVPCRDPPFSGVPVRSFPDLRDFPDTTSPEKHLGLLW
jgi:hypothetical protein